MIEEDIKDELSELNRRMKDEIVKFSYRKKRDNALRHARGTLQKKMMPVVKNKPGKKKPDSIFVYWDVDKNKYRSFQRKNFVKTLSESSNEIVFVYDMTEDNVKMILDTVEIKNSRYDRRQFEKYIGQPNLKYCGIFENGKCRAMAVLVENQPTSHIYIAEYQAFVSGGFAAKLLIDIIRKYRKIWLMADPTADVKLLEYYRQTRFRFSEYVIPNSIWGPAHFFYTGKCDEKQLRSYLDSQYTDN